MSGPAAAERARGVASPAPRSHAVDGIRALAALSVLGFHTWLYRENRPMGARSLLFDQAFFAMHLGLICFFVLSGYLLYRTFARPALAGGAPADWRRYAVRRGARIIPAYYVCILGCIALYAVVGLDRLVPDVGRLWLFGLFAQNYATDTHMQIDPVTWTLVVEMAFYIVLPAVGLAALLLGPRRPWAQAAVLVGLVLVSFGWGHVVAQSAALGPIARHALPSFLGQFAFGMLVAHWVERRRLRAASPLRPAPTLALAGAGIAVVLATAAFHESRLGLGTEWRTDLADLPAGLGFALLIAAAVTGTGITVRALSTPALAAVGVISYGIYLWHLPLLMAAREVGILPVAFVPRLTVVLALALTAGWLSWRFVERPAIAWSHRRTPARARAADPRPRLAEAAAGPAARP